MVRIPRYSVVLVPFLLTLLSIVVAQAQQPRYYDVWHLGAWVGFSLDFQSGSPVIGGSAMRLTEGNTSICDPLTGKTLFYTNGETVWNRNNEVMKNGDQLFGGYSSTQSSIVVPHLGDPDLYYLFTNSGLSGSSTAPRRLLSYSIVDMRGDQGLGEVTEKNIELFDNTTEKMTAICRKGAPGFWVVVPEFQTNNYRSWLVTPEGVQRQPVISIPEPEPAKPLNDFIGHIKASPDGTLLFAHVGLNGHLLRFDPATGKVGEFLAELPAEYAASFSPNNDFLYVHRSRKLIQYDLRNISESIDTTLVLTTPRGLLWGMQLAPDGKIYLSDLSFIENPNLPGEACNYRPASLDRSSMLPNFIDGFLGEESTCPCNVNYVTRSSDTAICYGDTLQLQASHGTIPDGVTFRWLPSPDLSCLDCFNPTVYPTESSTYYVTVNSEEGCNALDSFRVNVIEYPVVDAREDTTICKGESVVLEGNATGNSITSFRWLSSSSLSCDSCRSPVASPTATTTYYFEVTNETGCAAIDSITVTVQDVDLSIQGDTTFCSGGEAQLMAEGAEQYQWSPSPDLSCLDCPDPVARPAVTTTYYVVGTKGAGECSDRDSVTITVLPKPIADAGEDQAICVGENLSLQATGGTRYRWDATSDLSCLDCPNPVATPEQTTTYYVTVYNEYRCWDRDSLLVTVNAELAVSAGENQILCGTDSVQLGVSEGVRWQWSPSEGLSCDDCASPKAFPKQTTTYRVQAWSASGCTGVDSVTVVVGDAVELSVRGDTTFCPGGRAQLHAEGAEQYQWLPSPDLSCLDCPDPVAEPSVTTTYYVVGTNSVGGCSIRDSVTVTVHPEPIAEAGEDKVVCLGENLSLQATGGTRYRWDATPELSCLDCPDPVATPERTTTFYVTVYNQHGCWDRDSLHVVVNEELVVSAGENQELCGSADSAQLAVSGGVRWQWSPSEGLSCDDCAMPKALPDQTTTYQVQAWSAEGCTGVDSVTVAVRTDTIYLSIGREHRGYSGERMVIPMMLRDRIANSDIDELELEIQYDPDIMVPDPRSIERTLVGIALEGWRVEVAERKGGVLLLTLRAPDGRTLSGSGELLRFESRMFVSDKVGTELPFTVRSPSDCYVFITSPGYAEMDSICGLNFRLIEASTQKYVSPVAYPNPASECVVFEFGIGLSGRARLEMYDGGGQLVGLIFDEVLDAGFYSVEWEVGTMPTGLYWYRLQSGDWIKTGQIRVSR